MDNIEWDKWRCRCSAIRKMMSDSQKNPTLSEKQAARLKELEQRNTLTEPMRIEYTKLVQYRENAGKTILSDGCIGYLMDVYAWETGGRIRVGKELDIEYLERGKMVEQECIDLLGFVENAFYEKNKERIYNDFLSGEPDIFTGEGIYKANKVVDIKSCQDHPTFLCKINSGLENGQAEQLQGYGDITGAKDLVVANCLVNLPEMQVMDKKYKLVRKLGCATDESPEFKEVWPQLYRSMVFDDIPHAQRVHKLKVEPFTDFERQAVYDRVKVCREWLNGFHERYLSLNQ